MLLFKFTSGLKIIKALRLLFLLPHIHYLNLKQSSETQIGMKNFTLKIGLNHDINIG